MSTALQGKVALVAGATRGAGRGIAVELGAAGATVYCTGRSTRQQRSDYDRPETIEDTAELVTAAGGEGIAVQLDHQVPEQVEQLVRRVDEERGRLDVLVNNLGGENLVEFGKPFWEQSLDKGIRRLRVSIEAHMITSYFALGLLHRNPGGLSIEVTDGTAEVDGEHYRPETGAFFDIGKFTAHRMAWVQAQELKAHGGTAVSLTPGWLRSELMLEHFGVAEENWQDATAIEPHFCVSETPRFIGRAVAALAADPDVARWNGMSLSSGGLAQVYGFTDLDGSQPDSWRYAAEVVYAGKPANAEGYR